MDAMKVVICNGKVRLSKEIIEAKSKEEALKQSRSYGVMTYENGIVVVDCDNDYSVSYLIEKYPQIQSTYAVHTRRGMHFYFVNDLGIKSTSKRDGNLSIDIKASPNTYVIGEGSVVDGFVYQGNGKNMIKASEVAIMFAELGQPSQPSQPVETSSKPKIKIKKMLNDIKKYYVNGTRQDIVISLTGFLLKNKVSPNEVVQILTKVIEHDEEKQMRMAGVIHTISDYERGNEIKGYTGLIEAGIPADVVDEWVTDVHAREEQKALREAEKAREREELVQVIKEKYNPRIVYKMYEQKDIYITINKDGRDVVMSNADLTQIWFDEVFCKNKSMTVETLHNVIEAIASKNKVVKIQDFFKNLPAWDGVERISDLWHHTFGCPRDEYHALVAKHFFVQAIARALNPGCNARYILVLKGPQGVGKSRFCRIIGGEYSAEIITPITAEKTFSEVIQDTWICEIPEIHALNRANANTIKATLTLTTDIYRPSYGRVREIRPRSCVFVLTTNDDTIYDDASGGSRYLIVDVKHKLNVEWLNDNLQQLWAEALYLYHHGYDYNQIPVNMITVVTEHQNECAYHDVWTDVIADYLKDKNETTIKEIVICALNMDIKNLTKSDQMRITSSLKVLGYAKKHTREGNVWAKVAPTTPTTPTEPTTPTQPTTPTAPTTPTTPNEPTTPATTEPAVFTEPTEPTELEITSVSYRDVVNLINQKIGYTIRPLRDTEKNNILNEITKLVGNAYVDIDFEYLSEKIPQEYRIAVGYIIGGVMKNAIPSMYIMRVYDACFGHIKDITKKLREVTLNVYDLARDLHSKKM